MTHTIIMIRLGTIPTMMGIPTTILIILSAMLIMKIAASAQSSLLKKKSSHSISSLGCQNSFHGWQSFSEDWVEATLNDPFDIEHDKIINNYYKT